MCVQGFTLKTEQLHHRTLLSKDILEFGLRFSILVIKGQLRHFLILVLNLLIIVLSGNIEVKCATQIFI